MADLLDNVQAKMNDMEMEAQQCKRSEQTFQRWFGDTILKSADYLTVQFVEEVLSYTMKQLQKMKLEKLIDNVRAQAPTFDGRARLSETAHAILEPLQRISAELNRALFKCQENTKLLNEMTLKNPFFGQKAESTVRMLATCQTQTMESLVMYGEGEINHMNAVARLYLDANGQIPDYERVLLRDTDFAGGKKSHSVESWPPATNFNNKTKSDFRGIRISKIGWGISSEAIESLKISFNNGTETSKFGRKTIDYFCEFDKKVNRIRIGTKNRKIVHMGFFCEDDEN